MPASAIRRSVLLAAAGALAAIPLAASAQSGDRAIVVTGKQPLSEEQALETVRRVAQPVNGQLARFHDPVCPRVTGFDTPYEAIVAERIKRLAGEVGAPVGGEGCVANLYVVIVDDGAEFVEELLARHPEALSGLSRRALAELRSSDAAARAWSVTRTTNSLGGSASQPSETGGTGVKYGTQSIGFGGGANVMRVYESSTINPSVQQTVGSAWVVLETGATFGKTLTQIADYSALRGLAMVEPAELGGGEDTILGLFEPDSAGPPSELTEFDRAYLKGLYRAPARRWARSQVRYVAEAIADEAAPGTP